MLSIPAAPPLQKFHSLKYPSIKTVGLIQALAYWPLKILGSLLTQSIRTELQNFELSNDKRYIIAANHQSRIDPYLITTALPYKVWKRLGVTRYFTYNGLLEKAWLRQFLLTCGGFPAKPFGGMAYGIRFAERCLQQRQSIFIFPEGKRTLRDEERVKPGVARLAKAPNVMILPAHIEWSKNRYGWRTYRLTIGKPFDGAGMRPEAIMKQIYMLPVGK